MENFTKSFDSAEFKGKSKNGQDFSILFGIGRIDGTYQEVKRTFLPPSEPIKAKVRINGTITAPVVHGLLEDIVDSEGDFIMDGGNHNSAKLYSSEPIEFGFEDIPR